MFEAAAAAPRAQRLVYTSSVAAYGFHGDNPQPLTEDVPARGSDAHYYSAQKAELEAALFEAVAGSRARHVRLPAVHRRRARRPGDARGHPVAGPPLAGRRCCPIPGRAFQLVHHDDVAAALVAAARGAGAARASTTSPAPGELTARDLARELGWRSFPIPRATVDVAAAGAGLPLVPARAPVAERLPGAGAHELRARRERAALAPAPRRRRDARGHRGRRRASAGCLRQRTPKGVNFRGFPDASAGPRDARMPALPTPSLFLEPLMNIQRWTLVVVCAATAMLMLDIAVVNTALSRIAEDLDTGLSGLQWVVDAYTLALASTVLTAGALADRLGRRRLFTIGLAIFTLASLACGLAQDIVMLNSARAVQGVGAAIMFAVSLALLAHAFPDARERAGALAAYGAAIGASFALGPLVGGVLTSGLDWQWIFLVNLPIGVALPLDHAPYVEESRDPHSRGIDWPGQVTLTAGLGLLVLALLRGNEDGWTSHADRRRARRRRGRPDRVRDRRAARARADAADAPVPRRDVHGRAGRRVRDLGVVLRDLPLHDAVPAADPRAVGDRGRARLPARHAGHARRLGRHRAAGREDPGAHDGRRRARARGAGMVLMTLAGTDSSWLVMLPGILVACIGTGFFNPALSNVALGSVPVEQSGLAAGVNDTARQAGIAVGVAALGALIPAEAALGNGSPADYVAGLHDALYAGAALAVIGAVAAVALISKRFGTAAPMPDEETIPAGALPQPA